jgi:ribonuclease HII
MITTKWKQSLRKNQFEKQAWQERRWVCGIDEVGRGCLAGPVVAATVILNGKTSPLIKDSKVLTAPERLKAFSWIKRNGWYAVAASHHRLIDSKNIYYATLRTMRRAFMQLMAICPQKPEIVLVDAMPVNLMDTPFKEVEVIHFPFGEQKSSSIAAASIVAKVMRDALMERMHQAVPGYLLDKHKGYSTPAHKNLVTTKGPSFIHRVNYLTFCTISDSTNDELLLQQPIIPAVEPEL